MTGRLSDLLRKAEEAHREFFVGRWRSGVARAARSEDDAFVAILLLEALGVDNPASYFTLDLYPELVEDLHRWHLRMGEEKFPEPGVCC